MYDRFDDVSPGGGSSDRAFGITIGVALLVFGAIPALRGAPVRTWMLALSGGLFFIALLRPAVLGPANAAWTRLGSVLGKIVNPIVMGLIFLS